jgi:hypothetical protein
MLRTLQLLNYAFNVFCLILDVTCRCLYFTMADIERVLSVVLEVPYFAVQPGHFTVSACMFVFNSLTNQLSCSFYEVIA